LHDTQINRVLNPVNNAPLSKTSKRTSNMEQKFLFLVSFIEFDQDPCIKLQTSVGCNQRTFIKMYYSYKTTLLTTWLGAHM